MHSYSGYVSASTIIDIASDTLHYRSILYNITPDTLHYDYRSITSDRLHYRIVYYTILCHYTILH